MCYTQITIKPSNKSAPKKAFVPCGKCPDCRDSEKRAWSWRLSAELENCIKQGWKVYFGTLTYKPESLPHIPACLFENPLQYRSIPCFNREHIKQLFDNLRSYLYNTYKITGMRYFCASEFGDHTQRPHYHFILSIPTKGLDPVMLSEKSVDGRALHEYIQTSWSSRGFLFPRKFEGGEDKKGHYHKPFQIGYDKERGLTLQDAVRAGRYAGKYACKDLTFQKTLFDEKGEEIKLKRRVSVPNSDIVYQKSHYLCFHTQSQSLGASTLKNLTDSEKLTLYLKGKFFVGDDRHSKIPLYIKKKLLFDNYYMEDDNGNRLCRRYASNFFMKNKNLIFKLKVKYYENFFNETSSPIFWQQTNPNLDSQYIVDCLSDIKKEYADLETDLNNTQRSLAHDYLCYFGRSFRDCWVGSDLEEWACRYYPPFEIYDKYRENNVYCRIDSKNRKKLSWIRYVFVQTYCTFIFKLLSWTPPRDTTEEDKKKYIQDLFRGQDYEV